MTDRFAVLRQFPWPEVTAAGLATSFRWLIVMVAIAAAAWLLFIMTQPSALERSRRRDV